MDFQKMQSMSCWKLNAFVLFFALNTLVRAMWFRRGKGVRGFVHYPWHLFKYFVGVLIGLLLLKWRARIILSGYSWFRRVDDIMDRDSKPPQGFSRESYLAQKQEVIVSFPYLGDCSTSLLTEDLLLVHLLRESDRYGVDVVKEIINLWSIMCWDNERRSRKTPASREEMIHYATLQDISIFGIFIKVLNENEDVQRFCEMSGLSTGIGTRIDWLVDLADDLQKGVVNIPVEALTEYGLELSKLLACKSWEEFRTVPGFQSWYAEEIRTLRALWTKTRAALGPNFGDMFSSRLLTFIFRKLLVEKYERALEELFS